MVQYRDRYSAHPVLLKNIKTAMPSLQGLMTEVSSHWGYEDPIYRFYHHSFKVFRLSYTTTAIYDALKSLAPEGCEIDSYFMNIYKKGTGKEFKNEYNKNWEKHTVPILTAFFMARFMLEMVIKYGLELSEPPQLLPSGWAAVLSFYGLR